MLIVAEFPTPEGAVVVTRIPPQPQRPWVTWAVDVPGLGGHSHSRKRDALHHARAAVRLLTPAPRFDLVKGWDRLRTYE